MLDNFSLSLIEVIGLASVFLLFLIYGEKCKQSILLEKVVEKVERISNENQWALGEHLNQLQQSLHEISFNTDEEAKVKYKREWRSYPDGTPIDD